MLQVTVLEAQTRLTELISEAAEGQDVVIRSVDGTAVKLVPVAIRAVPKFGSAKGLIKMAADFNDPLPDFDEYAP